MDNQNYFITQLPKRAKTVTEALEMLMPKECRGLTDYKRQGEWFFIPCPEVKTKDFLAVSEHMRLRNRLNVTANDDFRNAHHIATEAGYTKKDVYARGTVRHTQGDHKLLKLGKAWHKVIESNHKQSWGAGGRID